MLYMGNNKIIKGYIGDIPVTHVSFGNRALIKMEVFIEKRFTPKCTDFSVNPRSTIIIEYTSEGISKNDITVTYDETFFTRDGDSFTLIAEGYSEIIYSVEGLSSVIIRVATGVDMDNSLGIEYKYYATRTELSTIYTSPGRNFTLSDGVTLIPSNANESLSYSFDSPYAYQRNFKTFLLMGQGNFTAKYQGRYVSGDIQINSNPGGDSQLVLICKSTRLIDPIGVHSVKGASDDWWVTTQNYGDNVNTLIATATVFPTSFKLGDTFNAQYLAKVDYLHTKNLTDMSYMFYNCNKLESIIFVGNASNVQNMSYMFSNCPVLTSINIDNWDTSSVNNMSNMFDCCYALSSLNIGGWDVSSVNNMSYMFRSCSGLSSLDLSNWSTGCVNDMSYMFDSCSNLYDLYVSYWDVSSVMNMSYMFNYCSGLSTLDLSNWYTYGLSDTSYMFYECSNLYELYLNNFDMSQVWSTDEMFYNCSNLQILHLDYCSYETVEKIITSSSFPEWNSGTIYCSYDVYSSLTPPGSWTLEPVW